MSSVTGDIHLLGVLALTALLTACGNGQADNRQGSEANVERPLGAGQLVSASIGDDAASLTKKNPVVFPRGVGLDEPTILSADFVFSYDDGVLVYKGCAWEVFLGADKVSSGAAVASTSTDQLESDARLSLIVVSGCRHYLSPDDVAEAAEAAIRQVTDAMSSIEILPRYGPKELEREFQSRNGVDCTGEAGSLSAPRQELACLYENAHLVWSELDGPEKGVTYGILRAPDVEMRVEVIATLPGNIDFETGKEIVPRDRLKPQFFLSVSFHPRKLLRVQ